ncbi:hypothetical protein FD754_006265 [Muntiacus muntjak]|uniref:Uncharacterized protein n=1 Tax=Muntiacus muntjak TaxID=9888 RepID=A0A5N3WK13_MUNMU|nr:hypothetical protein FD754_006265 [Muntiacus muntjak]
MSCHFLLQGIFPTQRSYPSLLRLLQKSAGSRVPASFAEPREAAASRQCHCARIQGRRSSSAGWRLLSGTVPAKAPAVRLPRSWEVRNRYSEEGSQTSQLLCPWNSPGEITGVGCHALHQGIFPIWGSNLVLLHFRQILYRLSHQGSP